MVSVTLKQGEAKALRFTVTDSDSDAIDCSSSICTFTVKTDKSSATNLIQKEDASFDKTNAATGILLLPLNVTDTNQTPQEYIAELKIYLAVTSILKSVDITFIVQKSVYI